MQFAVALHEQTEVIRFGETKSGNCKSGSLARALVFMNKQERLSAGQALYAKWLSTGQFRPMAEDILSCGLVAKSSIEIVRDMSGMAERGQVPKDVFVRLCIAVDRSVQKAAAAKAQKAGGEASSYLPKAGSDKGFVYALVHEVAEGTRPADVIDAAE